MSIKAKVVALLLVIFGMFAFSFLLVPLYDVICDITGINGKIIQADDTNRLRYVDKSREVKVQFTQTNTTIGGLRVRSKQINLNVYPGAIRKVIYVFTNATDYDIEFTTLPSISPGEASLYLEKIECFCFEKQVIAANSSIEKPVLFYLRADLPKNIEQLTLNYTIYPYQETALN